MKYYFIGMYLLSPKNICFQWSVNSLYRYDFNLTQISNWKEKIKRNFYEIMKLSYKLLKGYLTRQLRIIGICLYMYMLIIYDLFLKSCIGNIITRMITLIARLSIVKTTWTLATCRFLSVELNVIIIKFTLVI